MKRNQKPRKIVLDKYYLSSVEVYPSGNISIDNPYFGTHILITQDEADVLIPWLQRQQKWAKQIKKGNIK